MHEDRKQILVEDWPSYRLFVVESLDRIEKKQDRMDGELSSLRIRIATWGGIFGFIGGAIPVLFDWLRSKQH